jgi:hypothetical protein
MIPIWGILIYWNHGHPRTVRVSDDRTKIPRKSRPDRTLLGSNAELLPAAVMGPDRPQEGAPAIGNCPGWGLGFCVIRFSVLLGFDFDRVSFVLF